MATPSPGRLARARRTAVAALLAAIAPVLLIASPVAAANNINIVGFYSDCQFIGFGAGSGKTISIEWRDAEGNLKSKHKVTSNSAGEFATRCELAEIIESGDVLRTQIGTNVANIRLFTVPKLTLSVDRDTDTVSGRVQTNDLDSLVIEVDTYDGGFSIALATPHFSSPSVTPDTGVQGYSTTTWDEDPDIKGWDDVYAQWVNTRGDAFIRYLSAEGMRVWSRQPFIDFAGNPDQTISAELFSSPGALLPRGQAGGRMNPFGSLSTAFTDNDGDTVRTAVGNEVDADFASDSNFVVPDIAITVNKTSDKVFVDCNITETGLTGVLVQAYSRDFSKFGQRLGFQSNPSAGRFVANFGTGIRVNLVTGDKVDVYCKFISGDVVVRTFTI